MWARFAHGVSLSLALSSHARQQRGETLHVVITLGRRHLSMSNQRGVTGYDSFGLVNPGVHVCLYRYYTAGSELPALQCLHDQEQ